MIRPFAVTVTPDGTLLVLDPATSAAHRPCQPLTLGRALMGHQQVAGWAEVPSPPRLTVRTDAVRLTGPVLEGLAASGAAAVDLCGPCRELDDDLVVSARHLRLEHPFLVAVTTDRPYLERVAESLAGFVDAVRVRLLAPTEHEHDQKARQGQASYRQTLRGVRAAVDAGVPVELVMPMPPAVGSGSLSGTRRIEAAATRALQLRATGLTLLPAPLRKHPSPTTGARSLQRAGRLGGRQTVERLLERADIPGQVRVRVGSGRTAVPLRDLLDHAGGAGPARTEAAFAVPGIGAGPPDRVAL
ncbi:hypothetical protein P3T36_004557 [Kitasatospora sp. MAP12-15]|uniref:hypothetical protein n=1 Tax=unclassified Kitasatospora TaxID=2633591 RepID=UPI0024734D1E|nr:hypothetical protein [Kitasatospora sp. MAP12-44]MDH6111403.1 hypothetical protein [Kitasatospora sp. MAP12-44]